MPDDLRTRIAAAIMDSCHGVFTDDAVHAADAVIRELGSIPDRTHTDDQGRVWEWCGGEPGTWAWRVTRLAVRRSWMNYCPDSSVLDWGYSLIESEGNDA